MDLRILLLLPLAAYGCRQNSAGQTGAQPNVPEEFIYTPGKTIATRFPPPKGYERKTEDKMSFGYYLRNLPLKPHGAPVLYYNGEKKPNYNIYSGVVAMDIGKTDLQQCADAVMRLRAEYFYKIGQPKKVHFKFTNGFEASFAGWAEGYRISVKGNKASWVNNGAPGCSYASFRKYLDVVFSYAGTLSLSRELRTVDYKDMKIGDVLIQGGSPGHAVIVVDVAENKEGKKVYLLAQSYMPAQDIQVLNCPVNEGGSPWYELNTSYDMIQTPQWNFTTNDLKRFDN